MLFSCFKDGVKRRLQQPFWPYHSMKLAAKWLTADSQPSRFAALLNANIWIGKKKEANCAPHGRSGKQPFATA
jgi:hypothetical protein